MIDTVGDKRNRMKGGKIMDEREEGERGGQKLKICIKAIIEILKMKGGKKGQEEGKEVMLKRWCDG